MIEEGKTPFWRFLAVSVRFLLLGILALKNCLHKESEKENMEVRHYDKSEQDGDKSPKFDALIRRNTT